VQIERYYRKDFELAAAFSGILILKKILQITGWGIIH